MSYDEFVSLVAKMRHHQREFFRLHRKFDLDESKRLEKVVDKVISEIQSGEQGLF